MEVTQSRYVAPNSAKRSNNQLKGWQPHRRRSHEHKANANNDGTLHQRNIEETSQSLRGGSTCRCDSTEGAKKQPWTCDGTRVLEVMVAG